MKSLLYEKKLVQDSMNNLNKYLQKNASYSSVLNFGELEFQSDCIAEMFELKLNS